MHIVWGLIIADLGALFIVWGRTKSNFGLYRLLVARSDSSGALHAFTKSRGRHDRRRCRDRRDR